MPRRLPFKLPFTIALRSCSSCRDFQGLAIWPWSGGFMLKTHGLCGGCEAVFFQGPKATAGLFEEMTDSHRPAEAQSGVSWTVEAETLRIVASGHYKLRDVQRALRQGTGSANSPYNALLLDLTTSRESRVSDELRTLAADLGRHRHAISYRCAILVSDSMRYGLARMLHVFSEAHGVVVKPFRDAELALNWIEHREVL